MVRILLTADTSDIGPLDVHGPAYAIVAKGYDAPSGLPVVDVEAVLAEPDRWLNPEATQVVVGLSRLLTPSNRVKLGQALLRPRPNLRRVVVDDVLFVADPWRAFWPLFATRIAFEGYTDSYIAETRHKAAVEMQTPDPFRAENLIAHAAGHIIARRPFVFGPLTEEVQPATPAQHAAYLEAKEAAFAEEKTLPAIVSRLRAFADSCVPSKIPSRAALFRRRDSGLPVQIVRSDLGVHRFLAEDVRHVVNLTNDLAVAFGGARC